MLEFTSFDKDIIILKNQGSSERFGLAIQQWRVSNRNAGSQD